jgi:hypothetical protein
MVMATKKWMWQIDIIDLHAQSNSLRHKSIGFYCIMYWNGVNTTVIWLLAISFLLSPSPKIFQRSELKQ